MPTGYHPCDFGKKVVKILVIALLAEDSLWISGRGISRASTPELGTGVKETRQGCEPWKAPPKANQALKQPMSDDSGASLSQPQSLSNRGLE